MSKNFLETSIPTETESTDALVVIEAPFLAHSGFIVSQATVRGSGPVTKKPTGLMLTHGVHPRY